MLSDTAQPDMYAEAESLIRTYTQRHVLMDVGIGAIGLIPLPWLGTASLLVTINLQGPLVYRPLVRDLQQLYQGSRASTKLSDVAALVEASLDVTVEFGREFLVETAKELLQEHGPGLVAGAIPVAGGIVAGSIDAWVAVKLTRIVGAMALIYCENGGRWPASRKATKDFVSGFIFSTPGATIRDIVSAVIGSPGDDCTDDPAVDAATVYDGTALGLRLAYDAQTMDATVLEALERWKHVDGHSLSALEAGFTNSVSGKYADEHLINSLKAFVGEQISADETGGTLPDATNVPGWDIEIDGTKWQVKVGSTAVDMAKEAFRGHPEYGIITDPISAAEAGADSVNTMGIPGLEDDTLIHMTEQTATSLEDLANGALGLPVVSAIFTSFVELRTYSKGECSLDQAFAAITVKVGSRAAAMSLAAFVAVAVAAAAGTLPVSGPFLAGAAVTGAMGGRLIASRLLKLKVPTEIQRPVRDAFERMSLMREMSLSNRVADVSANASRLADVCRASVETTATFSRKGVDAASKHAARLFKWSRISTATWTGRLRPRVADVK